MQRLFSLCRSKTEGHLANQVRRPVSVRRYGNLGLGGEGCLGKGDSALATVCLVLLSLSCAGVRAIQPALHRCLPLSLLSVRLPVRLPACLPARVRGAGPLCLCLAAALSGES